MKSLCSLTLLTVVFYIGGCASIVSGQNQSVSVETRHEAGTLGGANCKLSNNKGTWFVTTPGSVMVQRSFEDIAVRCDKDSFEPGLLSVKSSTKPMAFGNILFGGVIGAGVDMSTGAAYDYPPLITVMMGSKPALPANTSVSPAASLPVSPVAPPLPAAPAAVPPAAAASGPAQS